MATYLAEFEDLANYIVGLPLPFLLSCFISGLTLEIHHEVQAHQPLTLTQAAGLAKLQEEKIFDSRPPTTLARPRPPLPSLTFLPPRPNSISPLLPPSPRPTLMPSTSPQPAPPPPFKRLASEEIASRRERGLCFSYDEKYHRGYRCASRVFLLLAEEEDPPDLLIIDTLNPNPDPVPDPPATHDPYPAHLSLNSLADHLAPETLRFVATVVGRDVVLLVDGGSTHNFIQH